MLLAGTAGARIVAPNFSRRTHERLARVLVPMIVPVVAIGAMHMDVIAMLMKDGVGLRI